METSAVSQTMEDGMLPRLLTEHRGWDPEGMTNKHEIRPYALCSSLGDGLRKTRAGKISLLLL